MKHRTIFRELILNIIIPVIAALLVLALLNYYHTEEILVKSNQEKYDIILDEVQSILLLQDVALEALESNIDKQLEKYSAELVNRIFENTGNIEKADLFKIREELGMNPQFDDIYIIRNDGVFVNTTFIKDLNRNYFDFGEEHKNYLLRIFNDKKYISERFTIEASTLRLKKYTYHPTKDGRYIVELGSYSRKADEIIEIISQRLKNLSNLKSSITKVELFIGGDNIFSLNKDAKIMIGHEKLIKSVFEEQNSQSVKETVREHKLEFRYIYMELKNSKLYKGAVISIVSDRTDEVKMLRYELVKLIIIFSITLIIVSWLIYKKTRIITNPIKKLVSNVIRITNGNLNERADVEGNNEITKLSQQFNNMIATIEEYYTELEKKVLERTIEIQQQKEEIEAQRDALAQNNERLEIAYHKIEKQNSQITDSIRYAKRIQLAILPPQSLVDACLPNSFIFYRPKDIVSGDFYWLTEKEGKTIFAAVDCTGHGVPGAFMSIVGNDQLNYAVNVLKVRKPAEILDALNEGVTRSLRQRTDRESIKDGMDIALCSIDYANLKLEYAGAHNQLCLVRNKEIIEIKADKIPIGPSYDGVFKKFTNHEIDLISGDSFYIFSDGYADQFGGKNYRKFLIKRFRELFISIAEFPIENQKKIIEETLEAWQGENEQVDDILVIGVKIN